MSRHAIDEAFLVDIARQYREHVDAGRMPAPAIAAAKSTSARNVHRWIYEARKKGLLPPGTPPGLCGGKVTPKPLGSAGDAVRQNIKLLRTARRMSTMKLSEVLREVGRPIPATGITRIEKGDRRVDVDDLVALATVFGVGPIALFICAACSTTGPAPIA